MSLTSAINSHPHVDHGLIGPDAYSCNQRLGINERHYGSPRVEITRNGESFCRAGTSSAELDVPPPALDLNDQRHPRFDPRYAKVDPARLPGTESLAITLERVLPYWEKHISPRVKAGESVLIAAHGNSLRALVKHLDQISNDEIVGLNIPTGIPLVYELDDDLKAIRHYYLGDAEAARKAAEAVANQAKVK